MDASREDWKRLVDTAVRIKQLSPWEWMGEDMIVGIRFPGSGDFGFISVMGALGEHTAVAVYLGSAALVRFIELHQAPPDVLDEYPELLMEVPQLQASFEDRDDLEDWDRLLLRNLGMKFRGRRAWPRFQSFRPGFMPWRLELEEIRYLTLAMEQLEQVAPRVKESRDFLLGEEPGTFLIRSCKTPAGTTAEWADRYETIPEPVFPPIPIAWNPDDVKKLKRASPSGDIMELDFFMFPGPIGGKDQRPQAGYVLLVVHAQSSLVFGVEMLAVTDSFEQMLGRVPGWVLSRFADPGLRPKEIHVQSERLVHILRPAFQEIGTRIVFKSKLKKLRAAKREMFSFFAKRSRS